MGRAGRAIGFAVLAFSAFRINAQMGLLTTITLALAIVTDLLFLPALLLVGYRGPATAPAQEKSTMKSSRLKPGRVTSMLLLAALLLPVSAAALAQAVAAEAAQSAEPAADGRATDARAGVDLSTLDPAERGWEVAARSDRGFTDSVVDLEMILRNAAGDETTRTLRIATLEVPDENLGDRSLLVFESPGDIEGTALLSHAKILEPDDQWLYLPALKRVKRISSVNKSGPFVGSEFAFEDFTSPELEKFTYRWLRQEACGELTCDVVERVPRYEHSGYARQVSWVDTDVFQVRKVDFYNRRGDLLKTLTLEGYRLYDGEYWRTHRMHMVNHQTGKETDLVYSNYEIGVSLSDGDFVRGALDRIR